MTPVPPLALGGFTLRPWSIDDVDLVLRAARDPEIRRYSSVGTSTTPAAAESWIRQRAEPDRKDWVIALKGEPVGRVSLAHINLSDGVGEIGYWVLPEHRRRAAATTAVAMVERHAFEVAGLSRLVIKHEPENVASCELALSRGYLAEGTERGAFERHGKRRDLHVHGLLITDL